MDDIAEQQSLCRELSPIINYLEHEILLEDDNEARKLILMASEYTMYKGLLCHLFQLRSRRSSRSIICQIVNCFT